MSFKYRQAEYNDAGWEVSRVTQEEFLEAVGQEPARDEPTEFVFDSSDDGWHVIQDESAAGELESACGRRFERVHRGMCRQQETASLMAGTFPWMAASEGRVHGVPHRPRLGIGD